MILAIINNYAYGDEAIFETEVVMESLFILLTLGFASLDFKAILNLYTIKTINWVGMALAIVVPLCTVFIVYYGIEVLNVVLELYSDNFYEGYAYYDNPMLWAVLFVAITPPVFEELAFRGFLFNQLEKVA